MLRSKILWEIGCNVNGVCSHYDYIIRLLYNAVLLLDVRWWSLNENFFFCCSSLKVFYHWDLIIKMNNHNSAFVVPEYKSFKAHHYRKTLIFEMLSIDMIHYCSITYYMTDSLIFIINRSHQNKISANSLIWSFFTCSM